VNSDMHAEIDNKTEIITYNGNYFTRKEIEFMWRAYQQFDEFKNGKTNINAEMLGKMEKYTGSIPE